VLDVGCGDGYGIYLMKKNKLITNIFGIDIQDEAIKRAIRNTESKIIKADAEDLPFHSKSFDCVHCGQTLEHVMDADKVMSEIQRVARARVVISVPINGGISEQHVREYTEEQIKDLISKYFRIVETKLFTGKHKRLVLINDAIS
jgi:ubiquinone/menaquinone biosynthesis C-methylase UbiE